MNGDGRRYAVASEKKAQNPLEIANPRPGRELRVFTPEKTDQKRHKTDIKAPPNRP